MRKTVLLLTGFVVVLLVTLFIGGVVSTGSMTGLVTGTPDNVAYGVRVGVVVLAAFGIFAITLVNVTHE